MFCARLREGVVRHGGAFSGVGACRRLRWTTLPHAVAVVARYVPVHEPPQYSVPSEQQLPALAPLRGCARRRAGPAVDRAQGAEADAVAPKPLPSMTQTKASHSGRAEHPADAVGLMPASGLFGPQVSGARVACTRVRGAPGRIEIALRVHDTAPAAARALRRFPDVHAPGVDRRCFASFVGVLSERSSTSACVAFRAVARWQKIRRTRCDCERKPARNDPDYRELPYP